MSINPGSIIEKFRVTHILASKDAEIAWKKDCAQYMSVAKPVCQKLLDGSDYCPPSNTYVPPYCYAGSTVDTYMASNLWNYSRDFITRALYIGDRFYSLSESGVKSWNFASPSFPTGSVSFVSKSVNNPIYPVPMMMK